MFLSSDTPRSDQLRPIAEVVHRSNVAPQTQTARARRDDDAVSLGHPFVLFKEFLGVSKPKNDRFE
jgi:hypothetical protein